MPGEGNGNGNGNGDGDKGKAGGEELQTLKTTLEGVQGEMKTLKDAKEDLERKLGDADTELLSDKYLAWKKQDAEGGKAEPSPKAGEIDLDTASSREVYEYFQKSYRGDMEKAVKAMADKIGETEEKVGLAFAQVDLTLTAMKHPDFWDHKDAINKMAKDNPKWSAEKIYRQVKIEEKMSAEEKAAVDKKKAEEDEKIASEKGGVPPGAVQGKTPTKEEAAEIAYRKAFGTKKVEE